MNTSLLYLRHHGSSGRTAGRLARVMVLTAIMLLMALTPQKALAAYTVYVNSTVQPYIHAWRVSGGITTVVVDGYEQMPAASSLGAGWYYWTFKSSEVNSDGSISFMFTNSNSDSGKTSDLTATINTDDAYYSYNGSGSATSYTLSTLIQLVNASNETVATGIPGTDFTYAPAEDTPIMVLYNGTSYGLNSKETNDGTTANYSLTSTNPQPLTLKTGSKYIVKVATPISSLSLTADYYNLVGDKGLTGYDWKKDSKWDETVNRLTYSPALGSYVITYETDLTAGTTYNYKVIKNGNYSNGQWPSGDANFNFTASLTGHYKITVYFDGTNNPTQNLEFIETEGHKLTKYYIVSPELTNSERRRAYQLDASRNRVWISSSIAGDGVENPNYLELNWRDDDLRKADGSKIEDGTDIHWWIEDENGIQYTTYSGDGASYQLGWSSTLSHQLGLNATYEEYNCPTPAASLSSATRSFFFKKGADASYTFMLNVYESANKVTMIHNKDVQESSSDASNENGYNEGLKDDAGYYLVGNFSSAKSYMTLDPTNESHRKLMRRYYYSQGIAYTYKQWKTKSGKTTGAELKAAADSVVYRVHVDKPALGWGNLYLLIAPTGLVENWKAKGMDDTHRWRYIIRPQVHSKFLDNFKYARDEQYYEVDSRSLHGGLFQGDYGNYYSNKNKGEGVAEMSMAINPNMDVLAQNMGYADANSISGYEFSFNVTTSTYRLVINTQGAQRTISLRDYGNVKYYYSYEDDGGNIVPVTLNRYITNRTSSGTPAKHYRFFRPWYSTSAYALADISGKSGIDMFIVKDITATNGEPTITMQQVAMPTVNNTTDENDDIQGHEYLYAGTPMILAYAANDDATTFTTGLTYGQSNPVNSFDSLAVKVERLNVAVDYLTDHTDGDISPYCIGTDTALVVPQSYSYYNKEKKQEEYGYTYLFGFMNHYDVATDGSNYIAPTGINVSGEPTIVKDWADGYYVRCDLGFWLKETAGSATYDNDNYVQLPADMVENSLLGTKYSWQSAKKNNAAKRRAASNDRTPGMQMVWITLDDINKGQVTGITDVNKSEETKRVDNAWYTLQGVRVAKPFARGIYIHNGKKVIVK